MTLHLKPSAMRQRIYVAQGKAFVHGSDMMYMGNLSFYSAFVTHRKHRRRV